MLEATANKCIISWPWKKHKSSANSDFHSEADLQRDPNTRRAQDLLPPEFSILVRVTVLFCDSWRSGLLQDWLNVGCLVFRAFQMNAPHLRCHDAFRSCSGSFILMISCSSFVPTSSCALPVKCLVFNSSHSATQAPPRIPRCFRLAIEKQ